MDDVIQITGDAELSHKLDVIGKKASKDYARQSLRKGAQVFQAAERSIAPKKSGNLAQSLQVRAGLSTKDTVQVRVVPAGRYYKGGLYYALYQNFGWYTGRRLKTKVNVKSKAAGELWYARLSRAAGRHFIPGRHYMEKAYDQKRSEAEDVVAAEMTRLVTEDFNA